MEYIPALRAFHFDCTPFPGLRPGLNIFQPTGPLSLVHGRVRRERIEMLLINLSNRSARSVTEEFVQREFILANAATVATFDKGEQKWKLLLSL